MQTISEYYSTQESSIEEVQNKFLYQFPNDPHNAADLEKILQANPDTKQLTLLAQTLSAQGWAFVRLPPNLSEAAQQTLNSLHEYFLKTSQEEKISHFSAPQYGYQLSQHKEAMTILTGDMISQDEKAVDKLLPKEYYVQDNFIKLAKILDQLCEQLLIRHGQQLYGVDFTVQENTKQIPLLQAVAATEGIKLKKYGMLDCVRYFKKNEVASKNNIVQTAERDDVIEHIDPGLFSISLLSDVSGLELKDGNQQWLPVPINIPQLGVLWNGLQATQIGRSGDGQQKQGQRQNLGGWHRVKGVDPNLARMTIWYEVCVASQVSLPVQEGGMLALGEQNEIYMKSIQNGQQQQQQQQTVKTIFNGNKMNKPSTLGNEVQNKNANVQHVLRILFQNGGLKDIKCNIETDTVGHIKRKLEDVMGLRMSKMRIIIKLKLQGVILDDSQKLKYYGLKDGDQIEMQRSY